MPNTINKNSKFTCLNNIPFTNTPFASSSNYIDSNNKCPPPNTIIHVKDIVFEKEELVENKWLIKSYPNSNFKKEVLDIFKEWLRCNIYIVIQSEENISGQVNIMNQKRNDIKNRSIDRLNDFKYEDYSSPHEIPEKFIVYKYKTIKDFENNTLERSGNYNGAEKTIMKNYEQNDEIWYYSDNSMNINCLFGSKIEMFLLVRNNKIVCSPIINYIMS